MKRDMRRWVSDFIASEEKKALPILSFPGMQLINANVKEIIMSSELQSKAMKAVADRVPSAASVSLMDLSVEAECFGSEIRFSEDEVPTVIGAVVTNPDEADALEIPKVGAGRTDIYIDAIAKAVELITDRPVFAGVIGPFSLAGRIMGVSDAMVYCYEEPEMVETVLEKATAFLIEYCKAYKAVGANGIMMAEPLAGLMSPNLADEFSSAYVKKIVDELQDDNFAIVYHNCGDYAPLMQKGIYATGAMGFSFGDSINMLDVLPNAPKDVFVMGNVSPSVQFRNGTPESIRENTLAIMNECCKYDNFVIASGCDIPPLSPWDNTDAFFKAVGEYYNK